MWLCLPAIGAGLLLLIVKVITWMPLPGPFRAVRELPGLLGMIVAAALGALLGLVLAALVDRESLTVQITSAEVVLSRPGTIHAVPRREVAVAFSDKDQLVLLGRTGRELGREPSHLSARRLRTAFAGNGIEWADEDPYREAYRRWVPDLPELPPAAHALFVARQKALAARDDTDIRELRTELARLGFVVRDAGRRQYWRRADG